jgi:hypothetical protein
MERAARRRRRRASGSMVASQHVEVPNHHN